MPVLCLAPPGEALVSKTHMLCSPEPTMADFKQLHTHSTQLHITHEYIVTHYLFARIKNIKLTITFHYDLPVGRTALPDFYTLSFANASQVRDPECHFISCLFATEISFCKNQ
jgi:hypothetical protein